MDMIVRKQADYGIDAPDDVRQLAMAGVATVSAATISYLALHTSRPRLATRLLVAGICTGLGCLAGLGSILWSSKVGKLRGRDRLMETRPWRGDETVLDVGCGRGLLLVAAARRLTTGKAIGVDIWRSQDQSANRPETTLENAQAEGVADRIEIKDGDARQLPFQDGTFDVVISSLALHNIHGRAGRAQAVREMARVLKPGGHVAILDVARTGEYARALQGSGLSDVRVSRPYFIFTPLARIVTGEKRSMKDEL